MANLVKTVYYFDDGSSTVEEVQAEAPAVVEAPVEEAPVVEAEAAPVEAETVEAPVAEAEAPVAEAEAEAEAQ